MSQEKDIDEVKYPHAGGGDYDDMLLMENTQSNNEQTNMWYLDSGCSNHMTVNKNWLTKLDESVKKVIRFANGGYVTSSGKGNIVVVRKDGKMASITDVLYVPLMTSNLIGIGQLLAKGYNMKLEENMMKTRTGCGITGMET
ncbi:uncharacterized protein LOC127096420 [Lathyrus oleraceus]|uniref:uncharacterized protein LOC127096420 n=1 Tax=Pisum sativum TaxID=3888 RepID=UPI0021D0EC1C|nr:uncharacterized protein LOC127096420 [Pisum sativum]